MLCFKRSIILACVAAGLCSKGGFKTNGLDCLRRRLHHSSLTKSKMTEIGVRGPGIFQNESDELYGKEILQNLNTLRHEGSLCDVTLVVEGREFRAHRNVLAASSPYFRNMLTSDMREKTESKVNIEALPSLVMEDILSYLYTGAVEITNEPRARDLLFAADYLVVPRLNKIASDFLLRNLSVSTCISVYQLAAATMNKMLRDRALVFIKKNFVLVAKSEEFLDLSFDEVIELISSDDVEITAEDEMFEVFINWVEHSPDRRKDCLLGLLRPLRLTLVAPNYLYSKILQNDLIKDNRDCMELALKSMEVLLANQQDGSSSEKPRKCFETHVHCVIASGGFAGTHTKPSNVNSCFVPDEGKWYSLKKMITRRTFHGISSCHGHVYTLGGSLSVSGKYHCNNVERFDPTINSWVEISPLPLLGLGFTGVTSLQEILYVCGGYGNVFNEKTSLKKVFSYYPKTNTWQECAPMIHGRQSLCVVAANQHIYAIGGASEDKTATNTVQKFDPKNNKWMLVSPMTEKRKFFYGAALKNKIFVFGGRDSEPTCSAEMYGIDKDQWQKIPNMQVPRVCAGAAVVQGLIYVIGGNRPPNSAPEKHKRMIEYYDPSTGQWAEKGSCPCEEFINYCACCLVMIPKNLLKSLSERK